MYNIKDSPHRMWGTAGEPPNYYPINPIFPMWPATNMAPIMPVLAIGSIVHYVLPAGPHQGAHRPAMVSEILGNSMIVNLVVSKGRVDDFIYDQQAATILISGVYFDYNKILGTWHWPE